MEGAELEYRALLAKIYAERLVQDLDEFVIIYDKTPSCAAMASAVLALVWARGARARAVAYDELDEDVDNALLLMSPYVEGLEERAVRALKRVRRIAILHTPVFYALDEAEGAEEVLKDKEVRYAVRETPGEINIYKVRVEGEKAMAELYDALRLNPHEAQIVRRYEASRG